MRRRKAGPGFGTAGPSLLDATIGSLAIAAAGTWQGSIRGVVRASTNHEDAPTNLMVVTTGPASPLFGPHLPFSVDTASTSNTPSDSDQT
jgi:hypothetical protein